ncbi:MAG: hypothetical protein IJT82_00745, partial [Schwartzia sp.]|nr:hypothetical protein [Schwartzia sp. (in: firmicutes)]
MAEKKDYFPLLPKLKVDSAVNPSQAGSWENDTEPSNFLKQLVKSLAVDGSIEGLAGIDSIPDIWARPMLFQMALYDEQKASTQEFIKGLHTQAEGEWRALLAMIALKDVRHVNLRSIEVNLESEAENGNTLAEALKILTPPDTISDKTSWSNLYILSYQNIPIAITSPSTLLSPAADYKESFGGSLPQPWSANGYFLTDPIPYLTVEELSYLHAWLQKVHDGIQAVVPRAEQESHQACKDVLQALDEYRNAIEANAPSLSSKPNFKKADLNLNKGIFRELDWTCEAAGASASDSAVKLIPSPQRKNVRDIILVSPAMVREFADQEGISPSQLVVWPGLSANDITDEELDGERNRLGTVSLGKTEFRRPEEFFTDRLAVLEPGNAFCGTRRIAGSDILAADDLSAILPLKAELLDYFTPQDIAQRVSIESDDNEIRVVFKFPLSGTEADESHEYKFSKSYPKQDLIYLQTNVPVIEIWPNIKRKGWNRYYLYYENSESQNVNSEGAGAGFFFVYPWIESKSVADIPEHGLVNRYTARLNGFPDALLCTVNEMPEGGAYPQPVDVGMLLLREPQAAMSEPNLNWQVGVDFGTSSTMLYYREGQKEPKPLSFQPNLFQVTESGVARIPRTLINFMPSITSERQDGSFLSIFHLLDSYGSNTQMEIRPLQDGHVFFMLDSDVVYYKAQQMRIDANLKWKSDDNVRRRVAAYVKQICLQSLVEAAVHGVNNVSWNFSYPTAFSEEQQFAFRSTCEEAVAEAYEDSGITPVSDSIEPWSESKASAYYFNHYHGSETNFSEGAICLDIG